VTQHTTELPATAGGDLLHPLDRAAWASLTGPHAHLAEGQGRARRYRPDLSPFAAVSSPDDERAWVDLQLLHGPEQVVLLAGVPGFTHSVPSTWSVEAVIPGVQLVATPEHRSQPDDEAVVIGPEDAAEAADLVARTEPGPFRPNTYQLGTYLGLRRDGRLVALAGERLHPPGWSEISAVCTDPDHRRQGLATRLVRAVGHLIRQRGETPFLHTSASNTRAIELYLSIGYELRREVEFAALRTPDRVG
jgi:ribosomal protein S18 acetylase RimI-like enzyme